MSAIQRGRNPNKRGNFIRKRKARNLKKEGKTIDYKDTELLSQFITERKKILPKRSTGLNAQEQRKISIAIKRARHMALLPYTVLHK
ncbi:MAG: 30S ribosomal protein S18 [Candidatus Dadabacteria bacterium]|nr:30S ribosomal protein S18 [Candidatus Dadabacteria bacterium]NIQ14960.1 30S ribosomal protein S18 [Candidatus Dadabacteria bacterium]